MGGYGASRIGMKHPDVFGALYIMSPCCMSPMSAGDSALRNSERAGSCQRKEGRRSQVSGRPGHAIAWFRLRRVRNGSRVGSRSQNPPLYFDLPTKDGDPQPRSSAKFDANAPLAFVDQYIGNLKQYRAIAEDVGDQDGLRFDTQKFHEILSSYGIENSFELYHGTHTSAVADRFQNHVLPFFSRNLCAGANCK